MAFKIKKPIMYSTEGYKKNSPDVNKPVNIIGSGDITMKGVEFDVLGIDNEGNSKVMKPGKDYSFKGHTVIEIPLKKKMGDFKHSDAPDAKGKFKELSAPDLASWMIKSRKGNLSKIISSLNQQIVFRRNKDPKYAAKMKKTQNIVRKRLKKDDDSPLAVRKTQKGLNLKRWFKEEWKDEKGNVCGSDKNKNTKVCRPSKRVSKDSPKSWGEMTKAEKSKVVSAKKKVGMGKRRASSSNVA